MNNTWVIFTTAIGIILFWLGIDIRRCPTSIRPKQLVILTKQNTYGNTIASFKSVPSCITLIRYRSTCRPFQPPPVSWRLPCSTKPGSPGSRVRTTSHHLLAYTCSLPRSKKSSDLRARPLMTWPLLQLTGKEGRIALHDVLEVAMTSLRLILVTSRYISTTTLCSTQLISSPLSSGKKEEDSPANHPLPLVLSFMSHCLLSQNN